MMRGWDVVDVVACLESAGVPLWLDGGWGIDALVGEQTRDHDDLDVVIPLDRADAARSALAALGYAPLTDELPTRFVVRAAGDRPVDFHTITFEAGGGGIQQLQDGSFCRYPAEGFGGRGLIAQRPVPCLTAEVQVLHHLGYEPDDTDHRDMRLLHTQCGTELPPPFDVESGSGAAH